LGFNAHIKVYRPSANLPDYEAVMKKVTAVPDVIGAAPFVRGQVMIKTQPQNGSPKILAPMLLGIDPEAHRKVSDLMTNIVSGEFDLSGNGLVIGRTFADGMNLQVGDRVLVYSPQLLEKLEKISRSGTNSTEAFIPPDFSIRGIFEVGFSDYDSLIVVTSLEKAQELYALEEGAVHGLQVMVRKPFEVEKVAAQLREVLDSDIVTPTWQQENAVIFGALAQEKYMMFFILFFIMIVAAFGIVSSQITFVVQKTREIGILKAVGAQNAQILWLFMSQSIVVGVLGVGCGYGLGLLALAYRNEFLVFMRRITHSELLPAAVYQLGQLPAEIKAGEIGLICGTAFAACLLAGLFPAWKASRMQPVEALRYE
jgi:lipoprotein-releasing system permease protein